MVGSAPRGIKDIPSDVLAKANLYAKKAFEWMSRELERQWRKEFGSNWADSDDYYGADQDYGDAYWFAGMAGEKVLKTIGITEDRADIYWDDELIIEFYS